MSFQNLSRTVLFAASATLAAFSAAPLSADEFDSGSTGADGAFVYDGNYDFQSFDAAWSTAQSRTLAVFNTMNTGANRTLPTMLFQRFDTGWRPVFTETKLPYNTQFRIAYDSTRNRLVLFGGENLSGVRVAETWEFDGADWDRITTATSPTPRRSHAMAFDTARGRVVLFGGDTAANIADNETWEYDGINWSKITTAAVPPGRARQDMAFDPVRNRIVMFGGMTQAGTVTPASDTWEYNGTDWSQVAGAGGPSSGLIGQGTARLVSLAYHSTRNSIIGAASGTNNQLWEYNGTTWTALAGATFNMPQDARLTYEPSTDRIFMSTGLAINRIAFTGNTPNGTSLVPASLPIVIDMATRANGVWNYTNIAIPRNATVTFVTNPANTPVYWLAQDDVLIAGSIGISGTTSSGRAPGNGGPGGYAGGFGGRAIAVSGTPRGYAGEGPGGGLPGTVASELGGPAGHRIAGAGPRGGAAYGSDFLQPLLGGSGGGGTASSQNADGLGGGGGGGAIRISTSGEMYFSAGVIDQRPGSNSGAGSSGATHLLASKVAGSLSLFDSGNGRARVEAFDRQLLVSTSAGYLESNPPSELPNPPVYTITITSVDSIAVPNPPSGNITTPDVTLSDLNQITIQMTTSGVPQGTVLSVTISGETGTTTVQSTAVAANGTASATATLAGGFGTIQAFASFNVNLP